MDPQADRAGDDLMILQHNIAFVARCTGSTRPFQRPFPKGCRPVPLALVDYPSIQHVKAVSTAFSLAFRLLVGIRDKTRGHYEILICYDFDADNTLPAIAAMSQPPRGLRLVRNTLGKGVVNAVRAGFSAAAGDCIVITMADCSDPPEDIHRIAEKLRAGADVVAGSRYMPGGRQIGGPRFKGFLSRLADRKSTRLNSSHQIIS